MAHDHDHHHGDGHRHGHHHDRGLSGALRYLRWLPQMWRSAVNDSVVDELAPRAGERVVDIGAGLGAGSIRAAATGAQVIAVEPTPLLRRGLQARRLLSRHRRRLEVVDGAAEHLPVADRSVDAAFAVNTLHHWVDLEQGLVELARVLRPGGRILLVDEDFTDPDHPEHERFGSHGGPADHGFTAVDAGRLGELLRTAGFGEVTAASRQLDGRPVVGATAIRSEPDGA